MRIFSSNSVICVAVAFFAGASVQAEQAQLQPAKDNTLYGKSSSLSNARGNGVLGGRTGEGQIVRGVMAFDLSVIPPGSTVEDVSLTLRQTNTNNSTPQARTVSLHRVAKNWGEGTSNANLGAGGGGAGGPATTGDATWLHTFFDTERWENPGGDFAIDASSSVAVSANRDYVWRSATMVADVQNWVDHPDSNFGWLLRGDENSISTAKRFGSRESGTPPVLLVQFTPVGDGQLSQMVYFPQFGNGNGFFSRISLLNPNAENAVSARVVIRTDGGEPFPLVLNGSDTPNGIVEVQIPPAGLRILETNSSGSLQTGSVTVSSDAPVGGVIVFGGSFGSAGVVAGGEFPGGFAGPVESRGLQVRTGVAIQNLRGNAVAVMLELLDMDGVIKAKAQVDIPALGKIARFVDEMTWDNPVDFSGFNGSVRATGSGLSAVMIQSRLVEGISQLATLPVVAR